MKTISIAITLASAAWVASFTILQDPPPAGAPSPDAAVEVQLCDGETRVEVAKDGPLTRNDGQRIADALMAKWQGKNQDRDWVTEELRQHTVARPHDNRDLLADAQGAGNTYRSYSARDIAVWERETYKLAVEGSRVFHSADRLGSTIAVSCDMCHPDGANTHPETYPKFQTQLGKVVLLRDMINWCIAHPVRGKELDADDPRMRALEAFIYAQRKGERLSYGKH